MKILMSIFAVFLIFISKTSADKSFRLAVQNYNAFTQKFLDAVQPHQSLATIKTIIEEGDYNVARLISKYWTVYAGYLVLVALGLLILLVFTLCGLVFCCCHNCCNRCGANGSVRNSKHTKRKRLGYNTALLLLALLIIIGVIFSLLGNQVLLDVTQSPAGVKDVPGNLQLQLRDIIVNLIKMSVTYVSNFLANYPPIMAKTFSDVEKQISVDLENYRDRFINESGISTSYAQIKDPIIENIKQIKTISATMKTSMPTHKTLASGFQTSLNTARNKLKQELNNCQTNGDVNSADASAINSLLDSIQITFDYNKIDYKLGDTINTLFTSMNFVQLESNLDKTLKDLNDEIQKNYNNIKSSVFDGVDDIKNSSKTNGLSEIVQDLFKDLQDSIRSFNKTIHETQIIDSSDNQSKSSSNFFENIHSWNEMRYWVCLSLGLLVLFICLLYFIGLLFGICGERPFEDKSCCNRLVGSRFLMAGVGLSFIFLWIIAILATVTFIIGGPIRTELCRNLLTTDMNKLKQVDNLLNSFVEKQSPSSSTLKWGKINFQIPFDEIFQALGNRCKNSSNLIEAFKFNTSFITDMTEYLFEDYGSKSIEDVKKKMENEKLASINTADTSKSLQDLLNIASSLESLVQKAEFSNSINEAKKEIINNKIDTIITQLRNLQNKIDKNKACHNNLKTEIDKFEKLLKDMEQAQKTLYSQLSFIQSVSSSNPLISSVIDNCLKLTKDLNTKLENLRKNGIILMGKNLETQINFAFSRLILDSIKVFGGCKELAVIYDEILNVFCKTFLIPWNTFWNGIGWFIILALPSTIIAIKLADIYRKFIAYENIYNVQNETIPFQDFNPSKNHKL